MLVHPIHVLMVVRVWQMDLVDSLVSVHLDTVVNVVKIVRNRQSAL